MLASSSGLGGSRRSGLGGLRGFKGSVSSSNGRLSYMQGAASDSLKMQMIRIGENRKDRRSGNHGSFVRRKLASIAESRGLGPRTIGASSQYTGSDDELDDEYYI